MKTPKLVTTLAALREELVAVRRTGQKIGFVPTMGALHEGHLSLVRAAKTECEFVVVSIYVNPKQFGPDEDFSKYPRTLDADCELLAGCGADLVFAPADKEMYRPGHATSVDVGAIAQRWEGASRPGHFRGVATVVLKLLNMVRPDAAYFGLKDAQQMLVVHRMAHDLDLPTAIRPCPTVREPDGLAMSSRNRYLSPTGRKQALVLWRSLQKARQLVEQGESDAAAIVRQMRTVIETAETAKIDYVALVDPETLESVEKVVGPTVALLAVKIENTRLIDNCMLMPK
jgi:pantoate--beta-alanine ligase